MNRRNDECQDNEKFTLFSAMIHGIGVTAPRSRFRPHERDHPGQSTAGHHACPRRGAGGGDHGRRAHPTRHRRIPRCRTRLHLYHDNQGKPADPAQICVHSLFTVGENPSQATLSKNRARAHQSMVNLDHRRDRNRLPTRTNRRMHPPGNLQPRRRPHQQRIRVDHHRKPHWRRWNYSRRTPSQTCT